MDNIRRAILRIALAFVGVACAFPTGTRAQPIDVPADSLHPSDELLAVGDAEDASIATRAAEESGVEAPGTDHQPERRIRFELSHEFSRRLDLGRGYERTDSTSSKYAGSPERMLATARLALGRHLAVRVAGEKDAGEPYGRHMAGVDFFTANLNVRDIGVLESATAGDFVAHWGWGLLIGRPSFSAGARPRYPRSSSIGPYHGLNENDFLRGVALSLGRRRWSLAGFASRRRLDGRVDSTKSSGLTYRRAAGDGLHRTETELSRRGLLTLDVAGAFARVLAGPVGVGLAGYSLRFDRRLSRGIRPDEVYDFEGRSQWGLSAVISVRERRGSASAEYAIVGGRPAGIVVGGVLPVGRSWTLWLYYRDLPRSPLSLLASVPQRRSDGPAEEGGITFGIRHRPSGRFVIQAAYDQYRFSWVRFGLQGPSDGTELSISASARIAGSTVQWACSLRESVRATSMVDPDGLHFRVDERTGTWRSTVHITSHLRQDLDLDVRHTSSLARDRSGHVVSGHLLAFDVRLAIQAWLEARVRLALFGTASGEARVYAYEHGLSHDFSIPSFSSNGERRYVVLLLTPAKRIGLRVKVARTHWPGATTSGSGLDEVDGDRIRSIGLELSVRI